MCACVYTQSPGEFLLIQGTAAQCHLLTQKYNLFLSVSVFLVHPTSIAAVDGSTVEFTCTANITDTIYYRVNDTVASLGFIINKGFTELDTENIGTQEFRRNLSVTVSSLYNNTEILCRALGTDKNANSNTATLTVQGNTHMYRTINNHYCLSFQVHYLQLMVYFILSLIPLLSISHGVYHSLYLVHISLDITYQ